MRRGLRELGARRKRHSAILPSHSHRNRRQRMFSFGKRIRPSRRRSRISARALHRDPGGWWSHNFIRSKFLIESPRVIDELRAAGIEQVVVDLEKSTIPFPAPPDIDFERSERPSGTISPATQAAGGAGTRPARERPPSMKEALLRGAGCGAARGRRAGAHGCTSGNPVRAQEHAGGGPGSGGPHPQNSSVMRSARCWLTTPRCTCSPAARARPRCASIRCR